MSLETSQSARDVMQHAGAVLFDFDGVILDSEWPIYQSWSRLFHREGKQLDPEIYVRCIGSDFDTWSPEKYLEELTGKSFDWEAENAARQVEILRDLEHAEPIPGAAELFQKLANHATAVVSSS
ncbi:MAG: HAD family phosphatase, partial [Verrucomicrobiae bacterium]|nr:HAD family phosphatase [Verrucomicrobiae bacterium]NNJ85587.1 HAD family phosphatase [Akkermansiaceae bacterium]